ncbi:MAG: hypothetical protein ABSC55_10705 [Syntrophorhabdales bacterium]|jgi:hypothetical protein
MKEWQTFVRRFADMKEGEKEIFIKDLTEGKRKYDTKHVFATVAKTKDGMKDPDILWIRGESGEKAKQPWYIKIKKELPEYIAGRPWDDLLEIMAKSQK